MECLFLDPVQFIHLKFECFQLFTDIVLTRAFLGLAIGLQGAPGDFGLDILFECRDGVTNDGNN